MNKSVPLTAILFSLIFAPSAIAQVAVSSQFKCKNYQLALRVTNNVIKLFLEYGAGYFSKVSAHAHYRSGEVEGGSFVTVRWQTL